MTSEDIKISSINKLILSIKSWWNEGNPFYTNKLEHKNFMKGLEDRLNKYKLSQCFEPSERFIFLNAIESLEEKGYYDFNPDGDKTYKNFLDSFVLNGYDVVSIDNKEGAFLFIDKNMSTEKMNKFKELCAIRKHNVNRNLISAQKNLSEIKSIELAFNWEILFPKEKNQ